MQKGKAGIWTASVELVPGKHTYRFIVDGQWRDDPECGVRVSNPYGSQDMVREAIGALGRGLVVVCVAGGACLSLTPFLLEYRVVAGLGKRGNEPRPWTNSGCWRV